MGNATWTPGSRLNGFASYTRGFTSGPYCAGKDRHTGVFSWRSGTLELLLTFQQERGSLPEPSGRHAGDGPSWLASSLTRTLRPQSQPSLTCLLSLPVTCSCHKRLQSLEKFSSSSSGCSCPLVSILLNVYVSISLASSKSRSESCVFSFPKWKLVSRGGLANWLKNKESI